MEDGGKLCDSIINGSWKPTLSIADLIEKIEQILINPPPDAILDEEIGGLYATNRNKFYKNAKKWVKKYAK
ncbi:hypothetical protein MHBO_002793 [Bonamia ostreae]|uniref:UBC core domain-containing protein n=1 Tax=Bonamia ostreae TaxID=126728 RepID=A0ABV2ANI7_9EUKA